MSTESTTPPKGSPVRYVVVKGPRCPSCGSTHLRAYSTRRRPGSIVVTRYTRCETCSAKFIVRVE